MTEKVEYHQTFHYHRHHHVRSFLQILIPKVIIIDGQLHILVIYYHHHPNHNHHHHSYHLDEYAIAIRNDAKLKNAAAAMKEKFVTSTQALLHGDLHRYR